MSPRRQRVELPILTFVAFLALWEGTTRALNVPPYLLPSPSAIAAGAVALGPALFTNAGATLLTILLGFAIACMVGIPLGILLSVNRVVSDALYPLIVFTHAIPIIAIAPIIVVMFGTELTSRLIIVVLITFFPIMVATASGVLDTPPDLMELAAATGASRLDTIRTIRLPHAINFIFGGLRIGITVAVVGTVVSEFVSSDVGLGYLVVTATTHFDIPMAMAAVILLAAISVVLYMIVGGLHQKVFPWSIRPTRR